MVTSLKPSFLRRTFQHESLFDRKDPSTCLDQVVLPEFGAHLDLPLHEKTVVTVQPNESGEFGFACGMNMFHGKIIVD